MTALHVLVIDDDPALLQALPETLRLRMSGVTVDTADSAAAALDPITPDSPNGPRLKIANKCRSAILHPWSRDTSCPGLRRDRRRHQDAGHGRSRPVD